MDRRFLFLLGSGNRPGDVLRDHEALIDAKSFFAAHDPGA